MAASMSEIGKQSEQNSKLVFEKSDFSNPKSKHLTYIGNHFFNNSIGIVLPGCDTLPDDIHSLCMEEQSFIVYNLALSELIHTDLINAFMRRGLLYILSHGTEIDTTDCVCVLPTGHMVLNLCKDTYQQLGLEGKPSAFFRKPTNKYVVDVDLLDPKFKPGSKKYDRVKWCFESRLNLTFDFLVSWTPNDDDLCRSSIQKYFNMKGYKSSQLKNKCDKKKFSDIPLPELDPSVTDFDKSDANPAEVLEWIGGLSTDIDLSGDVDSYISSYSYTGPTTQITKCVQHQYTSFYTPNTICSLVSKLRECVKSNNLPWCSLTVHGFTDSPVSWGTHEHGHFDSGDNLYTCIIFTDDQYWLYSATSEHDVVS